YDVVVLGAGPGGYVCAIRAAQLGLSVACIEGRGTLGGTCLNVGCIPSKALLHASHMVHEANHHFDAMGIGCGDVSVDWNKMQSYKEGIVGGNTSGIAYLFRKNGVDWLQGWGRILDANTVSAGDETVGAKSIVIASGSEPATLKGIAINEETIVSSTGALALPAIPGRMVVIGGGIIGLEMGSVYARLGTRVHVLEYLDQIAPGMDSDIRRSLLTILKKQGLTFTLGAEVKSVRKVKAGHAVSYTEHATGKDGKITTDIVLVATGRRAYTEGLGLDEIGIAMNEQGRVITDHHGMTSVDGIYAVGDVTTGIMLAHKAEEEGVAVAERLAGQAGHVNHDVIPSIIYIHPEVAAVGRSEDDLKASGTPYRVGRFPFRGNARAKSVFADEGFVKMLANDTTDRILGCHIIGPAASDMIQEVCLAMEFGAAAEDIARTCHGHPTYSEALREAALACGSGAIHA
ncbi:MAG: dihydrolipoyl dehydrogenase, partial [Rhodobacteraceae bacterium]|nr:dihydrolipoyl dehydrogenase [Paracoccaceae bacterium]